MSFSIIKSDKFHMFLLMILAIGITLLSATPSIFAEEDKMTETMCSIINYVQGPLGKSITIIVVMSAGGMLFFGKLSWGAATAIFLGVGSIFGAVAIVSGITGGGDLCATDPKS
ncbi:TrbC/VirB2 family type IV secretion system protein [Lyticum sinuosum]|uniref:Type IV secretion system protein VirB2 n=1 Tax=Lyticum sinuosum TaxID=1332059 RepID=A0AAE4VLD2_9RICK|nr:TrbC/VirB2 family protein [Lyticum sinuosum]MDZ5761579.1 Type IV secretion system protein VirB2 [Lyticum sinuosum]